MLGAQLCVCMNRDPNLPTPPPDTLCRRGQVQYKLMTVFNKVRALYITVWVRKLPLASVLCLVSALAIDSHEPPSCLRPCKRRWCC